MTKKTVWEKIKKSGQGYAFFAPNLLGFVIFFAIPILWSLYFSFTKYDGFMDPKWVGLDNYKAILDNDPMSTDIPYYFYKSLRNTIHYCAGYIPLSIGISLFLSILLNTRLAGMKVFRAIYFLPVVSSVVAVSILWRWLFAVDYGPVNHFLVSIGGESWRLGWLKDPTWAMNGIIIMTVWRTLGYNIVIFLASLQGVPIELYEAAYVDGASRWQVIRKITLPMISPAIFFVLIMSLITGLQMFNEVYVMTQGGPARSTMTVTYNLYQQGFSFLKFGVSSAMGWVLFIIIFSVTLAQNKFADRWVHYS
jgi:multiple sugar transport system permease protein